MPKSFNSLVSSCVLVLGGTLIGDAQGTPPSEQLEVVLDSGSTPPPAPSPGTGHPPDPATDPHNAILVQDGAPLHPAYRVSGMTLNEFAQIMAQKAGLSYVRNPLVDFPVHPNQPGFPASSGPPLVEGTFTVSDPLTMLQAAARAHGYKVINRDGILELENGETEKNLPEVTYTYTFRYLRMPRFNLIKDDSSSSSTVNNSNAGPVVSGISGSGGSSGTSQDSTRSYGTNLEQSERKMVDFFRGLLSTNAYINFNAKTNTLVARDIDANIAMLDTLIKRLDVEKPNVLTAVTALEVEANPQTQLGIDWSSLGGTGVPLQLDAVNTLGQIFFPGQNILGFGSSKVATASQTTERNSRYAAVVTPGTVSAVVRALQTKGLAEIRARFFVCTEDNEAGQTRITSDFPILKSYTASTATTAGAGGQPTPVLENADIGNTIQVIPQLLPNNMVRLQIKPIIRSLGDQRTIDLGQPVGNVRVDVIQNRTTDVTVRVPLNRSLVLGGLNQLFFADASNKIPGLGDLPLLNFFFSSKNYQRQARNLVLIVEPSILDPNDPDALTKTVQDYRQKLHEDTDPAYLPLSSKKIPQNL